MVFWRLLIVFLMFSVFCNAADAKQKKIKRAKVYSKNYAKPTTIYGKQNLSYTINKIIRGLDKGAVIGINIRSMKNGETIYTKNNNRAFIPASILKVFTAEAALLYLGSDYKFPTTLLTDATDINNGYIDGNVYVIQSGDPSLTYADLVELMGSLQSQDIKGVSGNIYIDHSAYDNEYYGPGWDPDDKKYCYAAPIGAGIVNGNCLTMKVTPAKKNGQRAKIAENDKYYYGNVKNTVVTKRKGSKSCYLKMKDNNDGRVSLSGCMQRGRGPWWVSSVVSNISEYNISMIKSLFKKYNIHVDGEVDIGLAEEDYTTIAIHHSKPLHDLVNKMLKKSDNVIAGSLLKKLGEFDSRSQGTWLNGSNAVKKILSKKAKVNTKGLEIVDGSGLSRDNKVKPSQVAQVLDFAFHDYNTSYEFIGGLPIAGKDGTLKNRLKNASHKVRAKTGTISGVVSLAGYVVTKNGENFSFVIIINGKNGMSWKYREIEDKIVTALTNYKRGR